MNLEINDRIMWEDYSKAECTHMLEQYQFVTDPNTFELVVAGVIEHLRFAKRTYRERQYDVNDNRT